MNTTSTTAVVLALLFCAVTACAGGPREQSEREQGESEVPNAPVQQGGRTLDVKETYSFSSDITGIDWVLAEVRVNGEKTAFDRSKLTADEVSARFFTLRFDGERVSGIAAPNRYFGPYTPGEHDTLTIGNMASTLMAALRESGGLREHEYYTLLHNVNRWKITGDYLELYSTGEVGAETALIFFAVQ